MRHSFGVFFAWHGLDSCWRSVVSEPKLCFLWVPKVTWSILFACFLLGMGSNLAGVSVFSNLTLTRLWAAIVRIHVSYGFLLGRGSTAAGVRVFRNRSFVFYGFQRWREAFCLRVFCLAWARILLVFRSFRIWRWRRFESPSFGIHAPELWLYMCVSNVLVRRPFWCTNRVLRALILLVFRSFRIYSWQKFDSHRQESTLVFICIYLYREFGPPSLTTHASACRSAALLVQKSRLRALILLLFRSFRIWSWRQFDQPSSAIHACVRFWLVWARVELVFGCLFGSEADEDYIHFSGWLIWDLLVAVFGRITSRSSALRDMFSHWVAGAPEISLQMFCSQIFLQKFLCQ